MSKYRVGAGRAERIQIARERGVAERMGLDIRAEVAADGIEPNRIRLVEMYADQLREAGCPGVRSLSPVQVLQERFGEGFRCRAANNSSADVSNLVSNTFEKGLIRAYGMAPATTRSWCREGELPDFKTAMRIQLSDSGQFRETRENGEIMDSKLDDGAESIGLGVYGRRCSLTLQMIINDDLRALGNMARMMGRQAAFLPVRLAYTHLLSNPTMRDGIPLFHADHGNYETGAGSALGSTSLSTMIKNFRKQTSPQAPNDTDLAAEPVSVDPRVLIVPPELDLPASQLANPNLYVSENQFFAGRFRVESEPRLSNSGYAGYSTTAWYLAAAAEEADTMEICYLNGNKEGSFSSREDFETLSIQFRLWLACGVKALDWRTICKADGA